MKGEQVLTQGIWYITRQSLLIRRPSEVTLQKCVQVGVSRDEFRRLNVPPCCLVPPPPATDDVLEPLHARHGHCDIAAWCVVVREDAALTKHLI